MKPKIVVIGSANMDLVVTAHHLPRAGETVLGKEYFQSGGGKGANQAMAAARLGADVTFIARLGKDHFGQAAFDSFESEKINTDFIVWDEETASGVALIMVDPSGENIICVAPGANGKLSKDDIHGAEAAFRSADCLLLQLEIPLETVEFSICLAEKYRVPVVLNPAPMAQLSPASLEKIDFLTPNKTEALAFAGNHGYDPKDLPLVVKKKLNVKDVVVTMGKAGAIISGPNGPVIIPAFPVNSVDATGAGDAFNGALVVALALGEELPEAVKFANAAAALSTTRFGAQTSMPTLDEVNKFLKNPS
jgi:ribokinase